MSKQEFKGNLNEGPDAKHWRIVGVTYQMNHMKNGEPQPDTVLVAINDGAETKTIVMSANYVALLIENASLIANIMGIPKVDEGTIKSGGS